MKTLFTNPPTWPYLLIPALGTGDTVVNKPTPLPSSLQYDKSATLKSESLPGSTCVLGEPAIALLMDSKQAYMGMKMIGPGNLCEVIPKVNGHCCQTYL